MSKVLMVEDDALFLKMYQKKFAREGIELEVAQDGEAGLEKAKTVKPDVVVLDLMLPKLSGSEVLKAIRNTDEIKDLPVIIMTNLNASSDEVGEVLKMGVKEVLLKTDVTPAQIVEMVEKYT